MTTSDSTHDQDDLETRVVRRPRAQAFPALIVAAGLLVLGAYYLITPVFVVTSAGVLRCGSALRPPNGDFARNVCAGIADGSLWKGVAALVAALVIAGLALLLHGVDTTVETRPRDDEDDD